MPSGLLAARIAQFEGTGEGKPSTLPAIAPGFRGLEGIRNILTDPAFRSHRK